MSKPAVVIVIIAAIMFSLATATNTVHRFVIKHGSPPAAPSSLYAPPPQVPTSYRYDVRVNPFKFDYPTSAPASQYAIPVEYFIPPSASAYAPPAPVFPPAAPTYKQASPAYVPAVPAPAVAYVPSHVIAQILQARAHQFIGRHYQHAHYH